MKKKEIYITILSILIIFTTVSFLLPEISASPQDDVEEILSDQRGRRISVDNKESMTVSTIEWTSVLHGISYTHSERKEWENVKIKLFLDGEEIKLRKVREVDTSGEENTYTNWFYKMFDPGYFEPGIYEWTIVAQRRNEIIWSESYPLTVLDPGHRINVLNLDTMTITTSQRSYVKHSLVFFSPEDIREYSPFDTQLYIDGVEVDLYQYTEIDDSGVDPIYYYWYYYNFDAGYFAPGIHEYKVVWTDITGTYELTKPLTVLEEAHRLNSFIPDTLIITTSQRSYIKHGHGFSSPEEILASSPFDTQLYIDGVEVDLYQYTEIDDSGVDPLYYYWYYYNFDAGYFAPGIYEWKVVWTDNMGTNLIITDDLTVKGY